MAKKQPANAEAHLDMIEARLGRIEALLQGHPESTGEVRLQAGQPGNITITIPGTSPLAFALLEKMGFVTRAAGTSEVETPVEPWRHLVAREHPWRKQLYIKGRNMTVRQLIGGVKANRFTPEQAAENYELPVEAIREALAYASENGEVLELDAAYERFLRAQRERVGKGAKGRGPQPVP